ncbi:MAG: hypothetical protein HC906_17080 [Bacteroidales bacterium]|nr:hypothetical protein [Bacteroidales bacterium]
MVFAVLNFTKCIAQENIRTDSLVSEFESKLDLLSGIHNEKSYINQYDKIITLNSEVIVVKVIQLTYNEIRFRYPLNTNIETIERKAVSQILYANWQNRFVVPLDANKPIETVQENRFNHKGEGKMGNSGYYR